MMTSRALDSKMERKGQRGSSPTTAIATPGSGGSCRLRSMRHGRSGRQWTTPSSTRARRKPMFNGGEEQPEHQGATGASRSSRSTTGSLSDDHHHGDASLLEELLPRASWCCCLEQAGAAIAAWSRGWEQSRAGAAAWEQEVLPGSGRYCLEQGCRIWRWEKSWAEVGAKLGGSGQRPEQSSVGQRVAGGRLLDRALGRSFLCSWMIQRMQMLAFILQKLGVQQL